MSKLKLLKVGEVAEMLRTTTTHVRNIIKRGEITAYKEGRKGGYRIQEEDVYAYVERKLEEQS